MGVGDSWLGLLVFLASPILFYAYTALKKEISEYMVPNSDGYSTGREYDVNGFFSRFPFPMREGTQSVVMPFLCTFSGKWIFGDYTIMNTLFTGLIITII